MSRLNPIPANLKTPPQPAMSIGLQSVLVTLLLAIGLVAFVGVSTQAAPNLDAEGATDPLPQQTYDPYDPGGTAGSASGLVLVLMIAVGIIVLVIEIKLLIWIYRDAEGRGKSGIGWLIFACICGLPACIIWLLVRPSATSNAYKPSGGMGRARPQGPVSQDLNVRQRSAMSLGHTAGETGMRVPRGSEAVEHSLFGEGGYFATHSGFDEEDEEGEDEGDHIEDQVGAVPLPPPPPPPPPPPSFPERPIPDVSLEPDDSALPRPVMPPPLPEEPLAAPKLPSSKPRAHDPGVELDEPSAMATIACPGCSHQFKVPSTGGLQTITCPACGLSGDVEI